MLLMLRTVAPSFVVLVGLLVACGGDDGPDAATGDAATGDAAGDAATTGDAGTGDAGDAAAGDAGEDAAFEDASGGSDGGDAGGGDAGAADGGGDDAGGDAGAADRGPIDCRVDADCSGPAASCNASAPGGICTGCAPGTCGDLECRVGACVRSCATDRDCNAGKRCAATGICVLRRCGPGSPCPDPYVCGSGSCERPLCADGCPAGWACEGSRCVEP